MLKRGVKELKYVNFKNIYVFVAFLIIFFASSVLFVAGEFSAPPTCYLGDGTNATYCTSLNSTPSCYWEPSCWNPFGCCFAEMNAPTEGCWQYKGNETACNLNNMCAWIANDKNQAPWCPDDVGCCDTKGCWNFDGDEVGCRAAFGGLCTYITSDPYCVDCCNPKLCNEILDEVTCGNMSKVNAACSWDAITGCDFPSQGGFGFFSDADSCMNKGGWWNPAANEGYGECQMPQFGGGPMFAGGVHCWFADQNEYVCTNLEGCAYCTDDAGVYGIHNDSEGNICTNKQSGLCEGHDSYGPQVYLNANNSANLACGDINLKHVCNCGPLPNCKWTNSTQLDGDYCVEGIKSESEMNACQPPAPFCEHILALNNETICNELINTYMMPCRWDSNELKCKFNNIAVFGDGGDNDYNNIGGEMQCTAAGGNWITENYFDEGVMKQESWCEKGAMFDFAEGKSFGNKGNCNSDCWACEFADNGDDWADAESAQSACLASLKGFCQWVEDSSAPNGFGYCDYPDEFDNGFSECKDDCKACDFMAGPEIECAASSAECKWVLDVNNPNGGFCVNKDKKICESDCFSCYSNSTCNDVGDNCMWDTASMLCKPAGFSGEICFDGIDNNNNGFVDCADPACSFDNACGGSFVGGECFKQTNNETCSHTVAFTTPEGNVNCSWAKPSWETIGHCDMPGWNCYLYNGNDGVCNMINGCQSQAFGGHGMCDINVTKMNNANCWGKGIAMCSGNCGWVNEGYGPGHCEFTIFAQCKMFDTNMSGCQTNTNCTWKSDPMSPNGGFCNPGCFDDGLSAIGCINHVSGLCEYKDSMCNPKYVGPQMGSGAGPAFEGMMTKSGCPRYDGNYTGCTANDISCAWKNDSYAHNNVSVEEYSGWCNDKAANQMFGDMNGAPIMIASDGPDDVPKYVDIYDLGIRDMPNSYFFGMLMSDSDVSLQYAAVCNGYQLSQLGGNQLGTGGNETRYWWYLDTDGISTDSCCANYTAAGDQYCGFEFNLFYSSKNNSGTIEDTKRLYRCEDGEWVNTNVLVTPNKPLTCKYNAVGVGIEKSVFDGFKDLYDKTKPMRILGTSANGSFTRIAPQDYVGPGYFKPGTLDFGFVDCKNPNVIDPKCKNFKKFGFQPMEDCHVVGDEDDNGLEDCNDPFCAFTPLCGGTFSFVADPNDIQAPTVTFSNVDTMYDSAFIKFDTNEPANGTVQFYGNDSTCLSLNQSIDDLGSPAVTFDDYKPFHFVPLDEMSLGFSLTNGTTYYFKTKVCDPSSNCGLSACQNFTTKAIVEVKKFIFKMKLPEGCSVDVPALNLSNFTFEYTIGNSTFDVGVKTNSSVTKNINITFTCDGMKIKFVGVDINKPKSIDLEKAFVYDESEDFIGMNSSSKAWSKLLFELGLGGYSDYIMITFPIAYSASNDVQWCDDTATDCEVVSDYLNCVAGTEEGTTDCIVPTSLGFSTYKIGGGDSGNGPSGGSGGGAGGTGVLILLGELNKTFVEKDMNAKDILSFTVKGESHKITLNSLIISFSNKSAVFEVSSETQKVTLIEGQSKDIDLNGDGTKDITLKLLNVSSFTKAKVVLGLYGAVASAVNQSKIDKTGNISEETKVLTENETISGEGTSRSTMLLYLVITIVLIAIALIVIFSFRKKK
jgi:hypothetical protein